MRTVKQLGWFLDLLPPHQAGPEQGWLLPSPGEDGIWSLQGRSQCWSSFAEMCLCPQEDRWAKAQDRAARKAMELKSLTMAIHSLFQAASTRLQPQARVAAGDSHRQLDMVRAEHSPAPHPGKAAAVALPRPWGAPRPSTPSPLPWGAWAQAMLGTPGEPAPSQQVQQGVRLCGAGGVGDGQGQGCGAVGMQRCRDRGLGKWGCRKRECRMEGWVQGCGRAGVQGHMHPGVQGQVMQGCRDGMHSPGVQQCTPAMARVWFNSPTEAHSGAPPAFLSCHIAWAHLPSKRDRQTLPPVPIPALTLPSPFPTLDPAVYPRPPGLYRGHEGAQPSSVRACPASEGAAEWAGKGQNLADIAD